ncbi:MAG: hypothetical protein PHD43_17845 [Methylococcales bacterium]|nr:hypothetical protein [Methylococcales bacterium]
MVRQIHHERNQQITIRPERSKPRTRGKALSRNSVNALSYIVNYGNLSGKTGIAQLFRTCSTLVTSATLVSLFGIPLERMSKTFCGGTRRSCGKGGA